MPLYSLCVLKVLAAGLTCSQSYSDQFEGGPWQVMKDELGEQAATILQTFCLENILKKVNNVLLLFNLGIM